MLSCINFTAVLLKLTAQKFLRHMRQKSNLPKINKNRAFLAENSVKMPRNQTFPFVTKSLKSVTSQFFPKIFTKNPVAKKATGFKISYRLYKCFLASSNAQLLIDIILIVGL